MANSIRTNGSNWPAPSHNERYFCCQDGNFCRPTIHSLILFCWTLPIRENCIQRAADLIFVVPPNDEPKSKIIHMDGIVPRAHSVEHWTHALVYSNFIWMERSLLAHCLKCKSCITHRRMVTHTHKHTHEGKHFKVWLSCIRHKAEMPSGNCICLRAANACDHFIYYTYCSNNENEKMLHTLHGRCCCCCGWWRCD